MRKRNAYAAMIFSFVSATSFYSDIEHNVLIGAICLVLTYFVSINYGLNVEEGNEENEQTYRTINRTRTRSKEQRA